jgi:hypothetical protein
MRRSKVEKPVVIAAIASLITAAAIPSALAANTAVPRANGNDVVLPDGSVYQFGDDGTYHLIPNVETGNAMGLNWNALDQVDELSDPVGDPIEEVASRSVLGFTTVAPAVPVTRANGADYILPDGSIYQLDEEGTYHQVPDVATGNAMHLDWNNLEVIDELDGPVGDAYPSVDPSS